MEPALNDCNLRAVPLQAMFVDTPGGPDEKEGVDQAETPMLVDGLDAQVLQIRQANFSREKRICQLKALFNKCSEREDGNLQANDFFTSTFAINRGKILNPLYDEVSKREKWGVWFEENFPGLRTRSANNWRSLARREDCHHHVRLGEARLLKLLPLTKAPGGEDPITDFLKPAKVEYDPAWETVPVAVKNLIDVAIRQAILNQEKKVLRDFRTHVEKLAAKITELAEDGESLKKVNIDKVQDLHDKLESLIERAKS